MARKKVGARRFDGSPAGIHAEILRYSKENGYVASRFADSVCRCGATTFALLLDDDAGAAVRVCTHCAVRHAIGDSEEYLADAELGECACPCGKEVFQVSAGVSLYDGSEDVRWLYLGLRCVECGLTAVYGDWKNECEGVAELLSKV